MRTVEENRKYYREYYHKNKVKYRVRQTEWTDANKERVRATKRKSVEKHRLMVREFTWTLKDKPCTDCGVKYPPYCMDFDHVRGTKKFNISKFVSDRELGRRTAIEAIAEEVQKCDVVCAICHRKRTWERNHNGTGRASSNQSV